QFVVVLVPPGDEVGDGRVLVLRLRTQQGLLIDNFTISLEGGEIDEVPSGLTERGILGLHAFAQIGYRIPPETVKTAEIRVKIPVSGLFERSKTSIEDVPGQAVDTRAGLRSHESLE